MRGTILSLNSDIFGLILALLDGQDGSVLRGMCRKIKHWVDKDKKMTYKIKIHFVDLDRIEQLDRTVSINPLESCKKESVWFDNVMWFKFGINARNLPFESFRTMMGEYEYSIGEGDRIYQDTCTKDLICCTNFYGVGFDRPMYEHLVEYIHHVNEHFPGIIKNWKLIQFPEDFARDDRHHLVKDDWGFHRGSSVCITFNTYDIKAVVSINKNLERMYKANPERYAISGRGAKRRAVLQPIPVFHPFIEFYKNYSVQHKE